MARLSLTCLLACACSTGPVELLPIADGGPSDAPFLVADGGIMCGGHLCACNNGIDDDGDGTIDGFDFECTSSFDDDEASFATGVPGDNRDPFCQDCFFDGNSGSGNDGCRYPTECLISGTSTGAGSCGTCEVSARCIENCAVLTPNGCDCFGCCTIERGDAPSVSVALGERCSLAALDDLDACPRCIPSTECDNPCGRCELCPGRTEADLPPDCGGEYVCEGGVPCSVESPCGMGSYCHQGCCLSIPI